MANTQHNIDAYAEIFNSSAESILVVSQVGKILMANPRTEQLFGYPCEELIGEPVEVLIPSVLRKKHTAYVSSYHQKPEPRRMGVGRDLLALTKQGKEFPIEVSLNPATICDEKVVIAFLIDISERKKIEAALERSERQLVKYATELESRVQQRTEELGALVKQFEVSNRRLESEIKERKKAEQEARNSLEKEKELNELKSRFVSMASHEFRTPLSTILSSASLISKYSDLSQEEKRTKHLDRIKTNVRDLTGILNDFLSLDKLEEGKIQNHPQELDLRTFIEDMLDELHMLTKKGQTLTFDSECEKCIMMMDPQILRHVISNLVSNAIKYSEDGKPISVELCDDAHDVVITVKDQGIGIPENEQKHLFERFFRAHNATHIQGTGLGLNLVKKYLDILKGHISYQSNDDSQGTTFVVRIPKP